MLAFISPYGDLKQTMSTLVIKNLPHDLHIRLRNQAERNRRSVTKEAISLIEAGVSASNLAGAPGAPGASSARPAVQVLARPMSADELDAALRDERHVHYQSVEELNRYVDTLRADRDGANP